MNTTRDCIFCQVVAGSAPCHQVTQDEQTMVFMDIFPVARGHALVVTREHFENIFEATPEALAAVAHSAQRVAHAIRAELSPEGLGVFQLNGAAAGQTVFHYHMHLIPRSGGDPLRLQSRTRDDDDELAELATRLAARL